jgi:hypothetical protein
MYGDVGYSIKIIIQTYENDEFISLKFIKLSIIENNNIEGRIIMMKY